MHKTSVWAPENLYVSLLFGRKESVCWVEKTGCVIRPRIDQLPGTGTDFYCIRDGFVFAKPGSGIGIACPDALLLQFGPIEYSERLL